MRTEAVAYGCLCRRVRVGGGVAVVAYCGELALGLRRRAPIVGLLERTCGSTDLTCEGPERPKDACGHDRNVS